MGKFQEWIEEHVGVTAGAVIAACFGAGYGISAWQWHQDKKFYQWKAKQESNMAYFMGTKDGAIKTLEGLLKEPGMMMDAAMKKAEKNPNYKVKHF